MIICVYAIIRLLDYNYIKWVSMSLNPPPAGRQAIIWTNVVLMPIASLGTNSNEIWTKIWRFMKMNVKTPANWWPFCLVFNVINMWLYRAVWFSDWLCQPCFPQICMCCVCGVMTIMMATLLATPYGGKAMFFIWICVIFLTFSGNFALFPTVTARAFGPKYVAINFGLVFSSQVSILLQWRHITMTSWHGHTFCVASYWCFVKAALDSLTKG